MDDSWVEIREVPGRGRSAFARREIPGGQTVLREHPFLLYPQRSCASETCAFCLSPSPPLYPCVSGVGGYCSAPCRASAHADPGARPLAVAAALRAYDASALADDEATALELLLRAASLRREASRGDGAAAARWQALESLRAVPEFVSLSDEAGAAETRQASAERLSQACAEAMQAGAALASEVAEAAGRGGDLGEWSPAAQAATSPAALAASAAPLPPFSQPEVLQLLRMDDCNAHGVLTRRVDAMDELEADPTARGIRGGLLLAAGSLVNHECLPTLARFDDCDALSRSSATACSTPCVSFRTLHAVPKGGELSLSYTPLLWDGEERRARCRVLFGFDCRCARCRAELREEAEVQGREALGEAGLGEEEADWRYVGVFLLKYVCAQPGCGGTLAPEAPGGSTAECNVCGAKRSEEEFLEELQALQE